VFKPSTDSWKLAASGSSPSGAGNKKAGETAGLFQTDF
jgi:hypothetical protein